MNRRVMAVTAAAVMSMSGFAVPAMADEEEAVSIQISASIMVNGSIDWRRFN